MFKFTFFTALMLLSASSAFAAPARINTLTISQSGAEFATLACTQDKLCIEIAPSQTGCEDEACINNVASDRGLLSLKRSGGAHDLEQTHYRLADLPSIDEDSSLQLWPKLIRFEGGILAGVETQVRSMYSGGGASSTTLHLIAFLPGQAPFKVLSIPQRASVLIRACFGERDMKQRAGACHDEYNFNAHLSLTGASTAAMPVLRYRSRATTFPGPVSRSKDSLAARPLRKHDIITATDPQCSYQRLYRFSPASRSYVANTPPPDCSNYTVP